MDFSEQDFLFYEGGFDLCLSLLVLFTLPQGLYPEGQVVGQSFEEPRLFVVKSIWFRCINVYRSKCFSVCNEGEGNARSITPLQRISLPRLEPGIGTSISHERRYTRTNSGADWSTASFMIRQCYVQFVKIAFIISALSNWADCFFGHRSLRSLPRQDGTRLPLRPPYISL